MSYQCIPPKPLTTVVVFLRNTTCSETDVHGNLQTLQWRGSPMISHIVDTDFYADSTAAPPTQTRKLHSGDDE